MSEVATTPLKKKDFQSDQEVRWCPGCGDYAILAAVQALLPKLGTPREKTVFVSGIGCSSRFPYYMNTYGFHTIHGRAPAFASGIKVANPELDVWMVTGDGDGLSIGGNHLAHIIRRNVDLQILLFNNEIYGLTKGQYSPTSPRNTKTKTSPLGSVDRPFNPMCFALGSNATFVARTLDTDVKHMTKTFEAAHAHKGTAFVEIYQNCVIFNKDFYNNWADRSVRADATIDLQHGQPMVYGKDSEKGLRIEGFDIKTVAADQAGTWDTSLPSAAAMLMAEMDNNPDLPRALGILRQVEAPAYEEDVNEQTSIAIAKKGEGKLRDILYTKDTWQVS